MECSYETIKIEKYQETMSLNTIPGYSKLGCDYIIDGVYIRVVSIEKMIHNYQGPHNINSGIFNMRNFSI